MWKVIANILLFALAVGLTIFTASRTLDLLAQWLPANQQIMQWLGLAAFEGGLYFWSFYFVTGAKGAIQRGIAFMMIVICFVGVALATIADLLLVGARDGKLPDIPTTQKQAIVIFVGVVIVLNVAAFLAAKLTHPDKLKEMAIQDAEDHIHAVNLAMIRAAAPGVAAQAAPIMTDHWVSDTWARMLPNTARPAQLGTSVTMEQTGVLPERTVEGQIAGPKERDGLLDKAKDFFKFGRKEEQAVQSAPAPAPAPKPAPRPFIPSVQSAPTSQAGNVAQRRHLRRARRQRKGGGK